MAADNSHLIAITVKVTVHVDPTDDELLERFDESSGSFSIADVVSAEIESNLESVSYVRYESVKRIERR
jgi:hypothetical protein